MAQRYRQQQKEAAVEFDQSHFTLMRDTTFETQSHIDVTIHGVAADRTHYHVAVSWDHDRAFEAIRTSIRSALSRALNMRFGKRTWFSDSPSRRQVKDYGHLDWLLLDYFPGHRWYSIRPEDARAAAHRKHNNNKQ